MIKNLLEETKKILQENNKTLDDIIWVGCEDFSIPTEDFLKLANDIYDAGFGGCEVCLDLIIVGNDWWLERHEYDGSEWWEYKSIPIYKECKKVKSVFVTDWDYYLKNNLIKEKGE